MALCRSQCPVLETLITCVGHAKDSFACTPAVIDKKLEGSSARIYARVHMHINTKKSPIEQHTKTDARQLAERLLSVCEQTCHKNSDARTCKTFVTNVAFRLSANATAPSSPILLRSRSSLAMVPFASRNLPSDTYCRTIAHLRNPQPLYLLKSVNVTNFHGCLASLFSFGVVPLYRASEDVYDHIMEWHAFACRARGHVVWCHPSRVTSNRKTAFKIKDREIMTTRILTPNQSATLAARRLVSRSGHASGRSNTLSEVHPFS